jgi:hypothetical protein
MKRDLTNRNAKGINLPQPVEQKPQQNMFIRGHKNGDVAAIMQYTNEQLPNVLNIAQAVSSHRLTLKSTNLQIQESFNIANAIKH